MAVVLLVISDATQSEMSLNITDFNMSLFDMNILTGANACLVYCSLCLSFLLYIHFIDLVVSLLLSARLIFSV